MKKLSLALLTALTFSSANALVVTPKNFETKDYYATCGDKCPEIDYQFIDTHNDWLDTIINKAVLSNLQLNFDDKQAEKRWQSFADTPRPSKAQFVNQLNFALSQFVKANSDWRAESESELNYSVASKPTYLGHQRLNNGHELELFSVSGEQYLGGAHGMNWVNYYVFDMVDKKQLALDDIIMPNQKVILEKIVKAEYEKYLKANGMDIKEMAETWEFFLTDNFMLDDKGITFLYQPYAITPYVMGMPEFTIPYSRLKGVLKMGYLP